MSEFAMADVVLPEGRWCAYAQAGITDERGVHVVAYVVENEAGFYETTYSGDLDYCMVIAASINVTLGLDADRVAEIVASSFKASR